MIANGDIKHIARLAGLHLTDNDLPSLKSDLRNILSQTLQLGLKIVTESNRPLRVNSGTANYGRDEIISAPGWEQTLRIAPQIETGMFAVPRVVRP